MTEPQWEYVVHADRQGWLVDVFEEEGKIPLALKRVESPYCPRGKVFLLPNTESYLNTLKAEPVWPDKAQEFAATWHQREFDRLVREVVERTQENPKSLIKIESLV